MDERDREIRNQTYTLFVELGRAPTADEVGPDTRNGWRRLHDDHAVVLDAHGELLMANPFSAVPTPHRVHAAGRDWYGNCDWDASRRRSSAPYQDARAKPARPSALAASSVSNSSRTNSSTRVISAQGGLRPHRRRRRKLRLS